LLEIQRVAPVSDQIEALLLARIQNGKYSDGGLFPSETQLCQEFNVSRATVRTAMRALAARGLLVRKAGIGTFLNNNPRLEAGLEQLESVLSMARRQGLDTRMVDFSVETIEADPILAERLSVPLGTPLTTIKRTITVDDKAASYHEDYLPARILPVGQINRQFSGSVLDMIQGRHIANIQEAETEITAVTAGPVLSSHLAVPRSQALILSRETIYDENGKAVGYSENYFVPDRFLLRIIRRKNPNTRIGETKNENK
jgi:GntR family transcriptional regulator